MWRPLFRLPSLLAVIALLITSSSVQADPGDPVAIRWWGQALVSIETHWNLQIAIDPYSEKIGYKDPHLSTDLVLISHEHGDHNNDKLIGGEPVVARGLNKDGKSQPIYQVLDIWPNQEKPEWSFSKQKMARSNHAVWVTGIPAWHDDTEGTQRGANTLFLVEVDGVRIVHCGDLGQPQFTDEQMKTLGKVDVLLIPVGGVYTVDGAQAADLVRQLNPRIVVPIHYKTPNLIYDLQGVQGFLEALGDDVEVVRAKGNTLAICARERGDAKTQAVVLDFLPWVMPEELVALFKAKEKSCRASQMVFAKLSAEQMNFKPGNGSHTPRWNTEHMMGRELQFFSQIFHKVNPTIPVLNINPKQMPPDYKAANPDWSGAEEARQMKRVSAFTRRYAYLLDGLPLDEKAPGSFWTPRRLLKQMDRHYSEHTANVEKKFDLEGWPAE